MPDAKHWVVTGASRGIGLEFAKQILVAGDQVTALVRNPAKAEGLQKLLQDNPQKLKLLAVDVTNDADIQKAAKAMDGRAVDVLINNAGIYMKDDGTLTEVNFEAVEKTFQVNSVAPMRVTKAFLPLLKKSKKAIVANITSLMGSIEDNGSGGSHAYRMSKAALNMFGKGLSLEHPDVTVLQLHPGWVATDMGGKQAPVSPADSAAGLLKVMRGATTEQSGQFFDFRGKSLPW